MSDIVTYQTSHGEVKLSPEIVRKYLVNGAGNVTPQEVTMFMALCKYQGLNPFLREAYLIKYGEQQATMVVGKDAFTKRAEQDPDYNGSVAGVCIQDESGNLIERKGTLVLEHEILVGGWAKVFRKSWTQPVENSVSLSEYIGKKKDGTISGQWAKMPATMIRKVALVQALREAFPAALQGLYDQSEMGVQDLPAEPVNITPTETTKEESNERETVLQSMKTFTEHMNETEKATLRNQIRRAKTLDELVILHDTAKEIHEARKGQEVPIY